MINMALDKISYLTKRNKSTSTLGHEERRLAGSKAVLRAGVGRPNVERGSKERGRGAEVAHLGGARATVG